MDTNTEKDTEQLKRKFGDISKETEEELIEEIENISLAEDTVFERLDALEKEIHGTYGLTNQMQILEGQVSDLTNDYCVVKADNARLQEELRVLQAVLVKKDKEIAEIKAAVVDQRARSMKNNILLHNIPEQRDENCETIMRTFLKNNTCLTKEDIGKIKIEKAHRVGLANTEKQEPKKPRMIVVKLTYFKDRERILSAWATKKEEKDYQMLPHTCHRRL